MSNDRGSVVQEALDANDIFGGLAPELLGELIGHGVTRRWKAGETIFRHDDPGESMMVVLEGRVKISTMTLDGKEVVLNFIDEGEVLGEIALLDGKPRTAAATAMEACELFELRRRDLLPFLERHPEVAIRLIEAVCGKLRHTTKMVEDLMFLNMGPRVARGLLRLAEEYGRRKGTAIRLDLKISQRDLGGYVGLARENINRQLKNLKDQGLVSLEGGQITILDEEGLQAVADSQD